MRNRHFHHTQELNNETHGEHPGRKHAHRDHHGHGRRPGRGRGGRAGRGDLRHVVLSLLGQESMHGYQIITIINERTEGNWSPSPGAIYPTLSMLEDEG
ncbi:MAG: PadR family transcriptional regulator, partial [Corynebacterium sp.]|nr:PadR family transcriptional regulator [Corynebacterium sp.]